jgi:hypothetical protein
VHFPGLVRMLLTEPQDVDALMTTRLADETGWLASICWVVTGLVIFSLGRTLHGRRGGCVTGVDWLADTALLRTWVIRGTSPLI